MTTFHTADVTTLQAAMGEAQTASSGKPQLVDVRSPAEFASGHVPGAVNLPLDNMPAAASALSRDQPVWLICRSGGRSARAAGLLAAEGFEVVNVAGGTQAWRGAGLPLNPAASPLSALVMPTLASLSLGLAPFVPEPHLLGKLRWVAGGAEGMTLMDWGDLTMHGAPWLWLGWTLFKLAAGTNRG